MNKPVGRVLVVGAPACRTHARNVLTRLPYELEQTDDPYAATLELCRRPLAYRGVVLCLNSIYREELAFISLVKQRYRHIDVFLSQTDGRQAATVEAMRRGADGLLGEDGLHRFSDIDGTFHAVEPPVGAATEEPSTARDERQPGAEPAFVDDPLNGEAVLTSEELRALLQEQPSMPPAGGNDL